MAAALTSVTLLAGACGSGSPVTVGQEVDEKPAPEAEARAIARPPTVGSTYPVGGEGGAYLVAGHRSEANGRVSPYHTVVPLDPARESVDDLPLAEDVGFVTLAGLTTPDGIFLIGLACQWLSDTPGCGSADQTGFWSWSFADREWRTIPLPEELTADPQQRGPAGVVEYTAFGTLPSGDLLMLAAFPPANETDAAPVTPYRYSVATGEFTKLPTGPTVSDLGTSVLSQGCVAGDIAATAVVEGGRKSVAAFDGSRWVTIFDVPESVGPGFTVYCARSTVLVTVAAGDASRPVTLVYPLEVDREAVNGQIEAPAPIEVDPLGIISMAESATVGDDIYFADASATTGRVWRSVEGVFEDVSRPAEERLEGEDGSLFPAAGILVDGDRLIRFDKDGNVAIINVK